MVGEDAEGERADHAEAFVLAKQVNALLAIRGTEDEVAVHHPRQAVVVGDWERGGGPSDDAGAWAQVREVSTRTAIARSTDRSNDLALCLPPIREGGDRGIPIVISDPTGSAGSAFLSIARHLRGQLG